MNEKVNSIKENIKKVMIGQEETIDLLLCALFAEGHVLIEDVPGMGKTVMARALARSVDAKFGRIQFTPDLLPTDVVGVDFFDKKTNDFVFKKGPAFCNILLADEINRATPRTQSSLLECMAEGQITSDGVTRTLGMPFFVIATQNPLETLGTYPLPEAQMDRFLMRVSMNAPDKKSEEEILQRYMNSKPLEELTSVCSSEEVIGIRKEVEEVFVHPVLISYMVDIAQASRIYKNVDTGVSPRGTLALLRASRAYSYIKGRSFVTPEDIKYVAPFVLAHRLQINGAMGNVSEQIKTMENILATVEVPTEDWTDR